MSATETNWSLEEFKAYLLLYCSHADFVESEEEIELIKSKIDEAHYKTIHRELDKDNDNQSIEKIMAGAAKYYPTPEDKKALKAEMKELFEADGKMDLQDRNLFLGLDHLLR